MEPNVEQTCSLFSSLTYSYLDPLFFLAWKQGGLTFDQIPVLADYDKAEQLVQKSFPFLDPHIDGASKHLLYGFLRVYRSYHSCLDQISSTDGSTGREYIALIVLELGNVTNPVPSCISLNFPRLHSNLRVPLS